MRIADDHADMRIADNYYLSLRHQNYNLFVRLRGS